MNYLHENHVVLCVLPPQSLAKGGAATGAWEDMRDRKTFCFSVLLGAVAASGEVTVELLSSESGDGAEAKVEGAAKFTAPEGGVASHVVSVCGHVTPLRGRYLTVKVTNAAGDAAVLAGAMLFADADCCPEETGGAVLVV